MNERARHGGASLGQSPVAGGNCRRR